MSRSDFGLVPLNSIFPVSSSRLETSCIFKNLLNIKYRRARKCRAVAALIVLELVDLIKLLDEQHK